jgi:hypothetical protein
VSSLRFSLAAPKLRFRVSRGNFQISTHVHVFLITYRQTHVHVFVKRQIVDLFFDMWNPKDFQPMGALIILKTLRVWIILFDKMKIHSRFRIRKTIALGRISTNSGTQDPHIVETNLRFVSRTNTCPCVYVEICDQKQRSCV